MSERGVDWHALTAAATGAMTHAYAPYSRFPVGAAALVDDGRVVTGCNVENASYGLGLCAECGLVSALHLGGGGRLTHFVCVDGRGELLMPCGRCRQLLFENGGPDLQLMLARGVLTMAEMLPDAFGPDALDTVSGGTSGGASGGASGEASGGAAGESGASDHHA